MDEFRLTIGEPASDVKAILEAAAERVNRCRVPSKKPTFDGAIDDAIKAILEPITKEKS